MKVTSIDHKFSALLIPPLRSRTDGILPRFLVIDIVQLDRSIAHRLH